MCKSKKRDVAATFCLQSANCKLAFTHSLDQVQTYLSFYQKNSKILHVLSSSLLLWIVWVQFPNDRVVAVQAVDISNAMRIDNNLVDVCQLSKAKFGVTLLNSVKKSIATLDVRSLRVHQQVLWLQSMGCHGKDYHHNLSKQIFCIQTQCLCFSWFLLLNASGALNYYVLTK